MKKGLFIVSLIVGLIACKPQPSKESWFKPNQKCRVQFTFSNVSEPKEYGFYYNQQLPTHQVVKRFVVETDTLINFDLNINHPITLQFWQKNEGVDLFLRPNDTLNINVDFSKVDTFNEALSFIGKTADVAQYLKDSRKFYFGSPSKGQSADSYNAMLDSFYRVELDKLDSVHEVDLISDWFYRLEQANIQCERDDLKFMQYGQHVWFNDTFIERDNSLENAIRFPDNQYQYLDNYNSLLCGFRSHKYDTLLQFKHVTPDVFMQYMSENMEELKNKDSNRDWSFFIASRLSVLFNKGKLLRLSPTEYKRETARVDSFIQSKQHLISNPDILDYMLACKQSSYLAYDNQNRLNTGDKAPNFYLKNSNDEQRNLNDFKGEMLLLNVWGTYCAPCIRSIPQKNQLLSDFSEKDFVLLNVCIDYNPEEWKQLITEHNFGGEHLICKGNWAENIKTNYNLKGVPHYCLIDKQGLVVQNRIHPDSLQRVIERSVKW